MPCHYPQISEADKREMAADERTRKVRAELNDMAAMLCSACRSLQSYGFDFATNPLLDRWWANHLEEDRRRKEQERWEEELRIRTELRRQDAINLTRTKLLSEMTAKERALIREFDLYE